jgi:hypothetical protein
LNYFPSDSIKAQTPCCCAGAMRFQQKIRSVWAVIGLCSGMPNRSRSWTILGKRSTAEKMTVHKADPVQGRGSWIGHKATEPSGEAMVGKQKGQTLQQQI